MLWRYSETYRAVGRGVKVGDLGTSSPQHDDRSGEAAANEALHREKYQYGTHAHARTERQTETNAEHHT